MFIFTDLKFRNKWILRRFMSLLTEYIIPELKIIKAAGTWKKERIIASPQRTRIILANGTEALNFCANNYLGLSVSIRVYKIIFYNIFIFEI